MHFIRDITKKTQDKAIVGPLSCMRTPRFCIWGVVCLKERPTGRWIHAMPHRGAKFRSQFRKTALCVFFEGGHCEKGRDCEFAHGLDEMRKPPDLAKTSLCQKWIHGTCPHKDCCLFAHGKRELRITEAFKHHRPKNASEAKATREFPPPMLKDYLLRVVPEIFEAARYNEPTRRT